jgi:hypothetical protein
MERTGQLPNPRNPPPVFQPPEPTPQVQRDVMFDQVDEKFSLLFRFAGIRSDLGFSRKNAGLTQVPFGKRQPVGYHGVERRRAVREKSDISVHTVLPASHLVKCRVTNLSTYGALLAVPSAFGLPDTFELRALGRHCHARVVRRGIGHAAIVFV